MKRHVTIAAAFWLVLVLSARGSSIDIPVTPTSLDQGQFLFSISTQPAEWGMSFHVTITATSGDIPPDSDAGLSVVTTSTEGARSMGPVKDEPPLTLQKGDRIWKADFIASNSLLENPNVCFVFGVIAHAMENGKSVPMPSADIYEIKLHDFLKK